ncbi:MAG: chemotaxis protein, partial [Brevundimonas sp.]
MVEQTTAAAANLKTEAESLAQLVGRFRTGSQGNAGVVRQLAATPRTGPPPALEGQRARLRAVANGGLSEEWTEF